MSPIPTVDEVMTALATVLDPEIHRPITDLGMVDQVEVRPDGTVRVHVLLTTAGCPLKDKITREPLVPYNAAGADNAPMADFAAACKRSGLWPFVNMNRTHVVPPCTITEAEAEAKEGLSLLDQALNVADRHTTAAG